MTRSSLAILATLAALSLLGACTKKESSPPPAGGADSATASGGAQDTAASAGSQATVTEIQIASVGDTMAFDKTTLEVKAGSQVKLTFKNNGTTPAMRHNWVLVKAGTENEVGAAGAAAGEAKGYLPDSPSILAHTPLSNPGETVSVTFTAPAAAGDYPYICTFPGHFAVMKGVLKVQ